MKECEPCEGTMWVVNEDRTKCLKRETKTNMNTAGPVYTTVVVTVVACIGLFFFVLFLTDRDMERKRMRFKMMKEKERAEISKKKRDERINKFRGIKFYD